MKMNKKYFLNELKTKLNYNEETIEIISNILDETFFIGINNKEKIITKLIERLNIDSKEANKIYNTTSEIIATSLVEKIKHPFKDMDK